MSVQLSRNGGRLLHRRANLICWFGGMRDAHFDFADTVQVFVKPAPVRRTEPDFQTVRFTQYPVENAGVTPPRSQADGRVGIFRAEEGFKDGPRIDFGRAGRGSRSPGDVIAVDTAVTGVAGTHHSSVFAAELERRNPGARAD